MHPALLNGHTKATIVESFTGDVFVLSGGLKEKVADLREALNLVAMNRWEVSVEHIHGSSILRQLADERRT
jgi:hypothetical protein